MITDRFGFGHTATQRFSTAAALGGICFLLALFCLQLIAVSGAIPPLWLPTALMTVIAFRLNWADAALTLLFCFISVILANTLMTGLPNPDHYATAHDMALLARAIIHEDPAHYAIYSQKEFFWNGIKQPNRNLLLWRDKTVDGLKTGHTEEAGYCMVSSAVRDGMRLIAVVFGTNSEQARAAETQKLLTYGFRFFETQTFYQKGTELAQAPVWKGTERQVKAGLAEDLTMTMPKGELKKLAASMTMNPQLVAPIAKGDVIGKVEVKLDDKVVHSANLIALDAVEEGGIFRRLWDSIRLFFYGLFN